MRSLSNYMSIGVDAKAALVWARLGKRIPWAFRLRILCKLWYIVCGSPEFVQHSYRGLSQRLALTCDGKRIEIPQGAEGLMVCNTPSYGGGSDLWDESRGAPLPARLSRFQTPPAVPSSMSDGKLEVVAVRDVVHLAFALGGLSNGIRLCQGSEIRLTAAESGVPLQIDGEPFNLDEEMYPGGSEPFDVTIKKEGPPALVLARGTASYGGGASAFGAVEGQFKDQGLSTEQRDELLRVLGGD